MAEGGYEDFELEEREEYGREYDNLDRETLDDMYEELGDQLGRTELGDPSYKDLVNRREYINSIRGGEGETSFTDGVPEPLGRYDITSAKSAITRHKKTFLSEHFNTDINKGDGKASEELFDGMKITTGRNDRPSGIEFEGVKVVVSMDRGKTFDYSDNVKNLDAVNRFEALIKRAEEEHANTLEGSIDEEHANTLEGSIDEEVRSEGLTPNGDVTEDIASNVADDIESLAWEGMEEVFERAGVFMTEQEVRELGGIIDPKGTSAVKITALEITANHYRQKALDEATPEKGAFYEFVARVAELKADSIRMEDGLRPEHEEAINAVKYEIENNDLSRLERFKKWAKENMVGLSAIAIGVAGLITTIVVGARNAIKQGARATTKFAKAVANLGKKLGSLLAPLLNMVAQVISWGAKGLAWLSNNLWILAIAVAWFIYDRNVKRK